MTAHATREGAAKTALPAAQAGKVTRTAPHAGKVAFTDLYELVRGPAALTVVGDTVAGAAAAGIPLRGRRWALPLASMAFYWAGMALNDWADRDLDAVERPERPIPSGRISAGTALATGTALTGAGVALAGFAGGTRALRIAAPLAASVWAYDTTLKNTTANGTSFGPVGMATCRALDVLLGAGDRWRAAVGAAAALGVHTFGVTAVSGGEVHGGSARTAGAALAGTTVSTALALAGGSSRRGDSRSGPPPHPHSGRRSRRLRRVASVAFGATYAATVGKAQYAALRSPSAQRVREATVAGIHGMVPLQAGLAARHGAVRTAALLVGALPLARRLAKKVSPT